MLLSLVCLWISRKPLIMRRSNCSNFQGSFLTSILMILQNFVKLACPEVAFPENRLFKRFNRLIILRSRKPLDVWPWNFYQMSSSVRRHEIRRKLWQNPESRKTRLLEMQLLGMLTSQNFAGLSLLTSEINTVNFRSISQNIAILQNNL